MKYHLAFIFGLILFITPFLGIPTSWKLNIVMVMGLLLMISALMRHYHKDSLLEENQTFSDSESEVELEGAVLVDPEVYEEEKDDY